MKIYRRGFGRIVGLALLGSLVVATAQSAEVEHFWDFVDRVVKAHPDILSANAGAEYQTAVAESMGWWDDPSVEVMQTSRSAQGQDSSVLGFALRQRLPFWGAKSRHRPGQQALSEAAKLRTQGQIRMLEAEMVQKIYLFARARAEQHHLAERRARLGLLKNALLRTKAASPGQKVERELVSSAIVLTESQFDTIDAEVSTRSAELERLGLANQKSVSVKWVLSATFKEFMSDRKNSVVRLNPHVESQKKVAFASVLQRDTLKPRPEFDVFAQSDAERGGARERNFAIGVGIRVPIAALFGAQKKIGDAEVVKAEAELSGVERAEAIRISTLDHELALAEKSLSRFNPEKMKELESIVESSEADARRGWVTVPQLLELERQIHSQIEATYDVQIRAVTLIKQACDVYECDARKYLGGSL